MNIPTYLTLNHYRKLQNVTELKSPSDLVDVTQLITGEDRDKILDLPKGEIDELVKQIFDLFTDSQPKFWPVFEFEGVEYGFTPPSKMTLGEWIDVESYSKNWQDDLASMMAVLYRPITKHNWNNPAWVTKYNIKLLQDKDTSAFDIYDVEKYDTETHKQRSKSFQNLPVEVALGAMAFFLTLNLKYAENSVISSLKNQSDQQEVTTQTNKMISLLFHSTMAGS